MILLFLRILNIALMTKILMKVKKFLVLIGVLAGTLLLLIATDGEYKHPETPNVEAFKNSVTLLNIASSKEILKVTNVPKKEGQFKYQTIEWLDLIPNDDLDLYLNAPEELIEEIYEKAMVSTNVKQELDGQTIRIAGFVVPLEFKNKKVTQFLLVPFFGACIHVPPPPPNQIILVDYPEGLSKMKLFDPIWVSGEIKTVIVENFLATSAYSLRAHSYKKYI